MRMAFGQKQCPSNVAYIGKEIDSRIMTSSKLLGTHLGLLVIHCFPVTIEEHQIFRPTALRQRSLGQRPRNGEAISAFG